MESANIKELNDRIQQESAFEVTPKSWTVYSC